MDITDTTKSLLSCAALNARLAYIPVHFSEADVSFLSSLLNVILDAGSRSRSVGRDAAPTLGEELYIELRQNCYPPLMEFEKQVGRRTALAILVLLETQRRNADVALKAFQSLRQCPPDTMGARQDELLRRRRFSMATANQVRLGPKRARAEYIKKEAARYRANLWEKPDIIRELGARTGLSASRLYRLLSD